MSDPVNMMRCPFCRAAVEERTWEEGNGDRYVCCFTCGAQGPATYTDDEAIGAWNRRAQPAEEVQPVGEVMYCEGITYAELLEPITVKPGDKLYTRPPAAAAAAADAETVRKALELAIENLEVANRCMDFGDVLPRLKAALAASKEKKE